MRAASFICILATETETSFNRHRVEKDDAPRGTNASLSFLRKSNFKIDNRGEDSIDLLYDILHAGCRKRKSKLFL